MKSFVIITGLPGSGKSTLSRRISSITGWKTLRSDSIRKKYFSSGDICNSKYSNSANRIVFDILYLKCELNLNAGTGVILDGIHFYPPAWTICKNIASRTGATLYFVLLITDYEILSQRIKNRIRDVYDSEAGLEVLDRYWEKFQKGNIEYPIKTEKFLNLDLNWYEMDAVTLKVRDTNATVPEWLSL